MDGAMIRYLRRRLGATQMELAERLDVDQGTVSRWERGVESPRPARLAKLRDMLLQEEDRRVQARSLAMLRHDILPATTLDARLRMNRASRRARDHYRTRGFDPDRLIGVALERFTDLAGYPTLMAFFAEAGILTGDALLFRFTVNFRGAGHTTLYDPIFEDGAFVGSLNYATAYFDFPPNGDISLELVETVHCSAPDRIVPLHRGARAGSIRPPGGIPMDGPTSGR